MSRKHNTDRNGISFSDKVKLTVWKKAYVLNGYDPDQTRKDNHGATIKYEQYGDDSNFGWEIDHIIPVSKGGTDELDNLQPLQWKNNRKKSDKYPVWD